MAVIESTTNRKAGKANSDFSGTPIIDQIFNRKNAVGFSAPTHHILIGYETRASLDRLLNVLTWIPIFWTTFMSAFFDRFSDQSRTSIFLTVFMSLNLDSQP